MLQTLMYSPKYDLNSRSLQSINSVSKQLNIHAFELKLLHTFRTSVGPFVAHMDGPIKSFIMNDTVALFLESEVVRNSIFSLACVNSWQFCKEKSVIPMVSLVKRGKVEIGTRSSLFGFHSSIKDVSIPTLFDKDFDFLEGINQSLYALTSKYFANLVTGCNDIMINRVDRSSGTVVVDPKDALILQIGVMVIFTFIGSHGHGLVPLVNFDENDEYVYHYDQIINMNTDFLTISHNLAAMAEVSLYSSTGATLRKPIHTRNPTMVYPIIVKLTHELNVTDIPGTSKLNIRRSIGILDGCLTISDKNNYPLPSFKFLVLIREPFRNLVRDKEFFALRVLYAFAFVCEISQFGLFKDKSIWRDYMAWFKNYNMKMGRWQYNLDYILWFIIEHDIKLYALTTTQFVYTDPEIIFNDYILANPEFDLDDSFPFSSSVGRSTDFEESGSLIGFEEYNAFTNPKDNNYDMNLMTI
ncbi:hypothetical protein CANTEDRAFT_134448 [Yamadazyma tenuis ATCC 10573]|uniref:Uncharacterized protein n=2 Tax=Candida tenuis TaxID=2315449 RepID=G3B4U4_CANTC|nr:uncharacterized protein CANTEDRAFT_134448 [Yamadazyma tenuis ATCC 10573]EGV63872.1 hypothetical protein CANTEDRAFT_134448 [Yamadazyma tenuis ATCC 10573]